MVAFKIGFGCCRSVKGWINGWMDGISVLTSFLFLLLLPHSFNEVQTLTVLGGFDSSTRTITCQENITFPFFLLLFIFFLQNIWFFTVFFNGTAYHHSHHHQEQSVLLLLELQLLRGLLLELLLERNMKRVK